ncbi:hypothetical protein BJX63DRAFT_395423 [Aspergillus granulosus]|uniref:Secreted protein n=1 Tax=Aspergillus granulosus TaxID=176169 RepID=A0ABR4HC35_9EURO
MASDLVALVIVIFTLRIGTRALAIPNRTTSQPVAILELPRRYPYIFAFITDFYAVITQR